MMKTTMLSRALCNVASKQCHTNPIRPCCNSNFVKSQMKVALRPAYQYLRHTAISASAVASTSSTDNTVNINSNQEDVAARKQTTSSTQQVKSLNVINSHDKTYADFTQQQMLLQQLQQPLRHNVWFPFPRQRDAYKLRQYVNVKQCCQPDPLAFAMYAGRTDPEWLWLKILCFICIGSTVGTAIYAFYLPEHVKFFKDEPWSPLRY